MYKNNKLAHKCRDGVVARMRDTARYVGRSHWQRKPYRHSRNPQSVGTMRARTAPALLLLAVIASLHCKSLTLHALF